jgi:hypothetical protein
MKLNRLIHRLLAVAGLRANTPARLNLEKIANSQPHHLMIVGHQYADPRMG